MDINNVLKLEFKLKDFQIENTIKLIDEGNTIPFIARYRKEMTGEMSDVILREFYEKLIYLRNLKNRKEDVKRLINEQGKLTDEITKNIKNANTLQEVEDIYAPFKQKKRTRATIAKEKGLEPLALSILNKEINIEAEANNYINSEKEIETKEEAIKGSLDIIAEIVSDDAKIRKYIREMFLKEGSIITKSTTEEKSVYDMYYDYNENIKNIVPHRVLAINRGEKEEFLKVKLELNNDKILNYIQNEYINKINQNSKEYIINAIEDAYKRLVYPSIEREIRNHLTTIAQERAISVFSQNIKNLLLQPPIKEKVVMGFDPAYRTGCKIAVVDENGKLLDSTTVYPTVPQNDVEGSKKVLINLINKYNIAIIAIGNGTASRESEQFVSDMIKNIDREVNYIIVNEAGASVYSASQVAQEEHPDINVSIRGAISIARRIQDPLAELVKIDPKSIGVGQYQHDLNQKRLEEVLTGVVEDAVNSVGVDLNTASYSLLSYVAGISKSIAKNIVLFREENNKFESLTQLKKVKRLGPAAFLQCAGFMRITDGKNQLDNTGVHPESYDVCKKLLSELNIKHINADSIKDIDTKVNIIGLEQLSDQLSIGIPTLKDIINEIKKPGRDPREGGMKPILRTDVLKIDDLKEGMILKGTVRNVVDFGAFIDIGIKNDGLVHISQMSNKKFIKNPMDIVAVGDVIDVKVISIDLQKQKVSLSMKIDE